MMLHCPYCGGPLEKDYNFPLSKKEKALFDAVVATGSHGMVQEDLLKSQFEGQSAITARTRIYAINRKIGKEKLSITGRGGRLYLVNSNGG